MLFLCGMAVILVSQRYLNLYVCAWRAPSICADLVKHFRRRMSHAVDYLFILMGLDNPLLGLLVRLYLYTISVYLLLMRLS
jgi:hypothetical protein